MCQILGSYSGDAHVAKGINRMLHSSNKYLWSPRNVGQANVTDKNNVCGASHYSNGHLLNEHVRQGAMAKYLANIS